MGNIGCIPDVVASRLLREDGCGSGSGRVRGMRMATLLMLPEDLLVFVILPMLIEVEAILGLSETCKEFSRLVKSRLKPRLEMFPFEPIRVGSWAFDTVRLCTTPWSRKGLTTDKFLNRLKRQEGSGHFFVQGLELRQDKCCFEDFDYQLLRSQSTLRCLELYNIRLQFDDLQFIQSIGSLKSLLFVDCAFPDLFGSFPPKLQILRKQGLSQAWFKYFPDSLELIEIESSEILRSAENPLPQNLQSLSITSLPGEKGYDIYEVPYERLLHLKCLKLSRLFELRYIPDLSLVPLETLEITRCQVLATVYPLPPRLRLLKIENCGKIENVQLPAHLVELECMNCENLKIDMFRLPASMKKIHITRCAQIGSLPNLDSMFPSSLQDLRLSQFDNITSLPDLPDGLLSLSLREFDRLTKLPALPKTLRRLELRNLPEIQTIPALPCSLDFLSFYIFKKNELSCESIPPSLRELKLRTITKFKCAGFHFPDTLKSLEICECPELLTDFYQLPQHLEYLEIENCDVVTIPTLPRCLQVFLLSKMKSLTNLASLPPNLKEFALWDCNSLREFPPLPIGLKSLSISNCFYIQFLGLEGEPMDKIGLRGLLPATLRKLELNYCIGLEEIGLLPEKLQELHLVTCSNPSLLLHSIPRHLRIMELRTR